MSTASVTISTAVALTVAFASTGVDLASIVRNPHVPGLSPIPVPAQGCCRVCRTGKACGDSCISRSKACHVPRGCACNG